MNAKLNETRLCYCNLCDKKTNFKNESRLINSKTHEHKQKYGTVVKEYEFIKPDIDEVIRRLNDTPKDSMKVYFQSFDCRCVNDNKFLSLEIIEEVVKTITLAYMEFESHFYALNQKLKNALKNGFRFSELLRLTLKIYSRLSNIIIC